MLSAQSLLPHAHPALSCFLLHHLFLQRRPLAPAAFRLPLPSPSHPARPCHRDRCGRRHFKMVGGCCSKTCRAHFATYLMRITGTILGPFCTRTRALALEEQGCRSVATANAESVSVYAKSDKLGGTFLILCGVWAGLAQPCCHWVDPV